MKQFIIQEHITYDSILKIYNMQALYCKRVYKLLVSGYSFLEVSTPLPVVLYRKDKKSFQFFCVSSVKNMCLKMFSYLFLFGISTNLRYTIFW